MLNQKIGHIVKGEGGPYSLETLELPSTPSEEGIDSKTDSGLPNLRKKLAEM